MIGVLYRYSGYPLMIRGVSYTLREVVGRTREVGEEWG
jgi:hypothetical protein